MSNRINIGPPGSILDWDNWGSIATNLLNEFDGRIAALEIVQGVLGTPTTAASPGTTAPNGAPGTETRDAVMGNYIFTAVAGRRYRVSLDSAKISVGTNGTTVTVRIRNGGASTPTAASTLIAETSYYGAIAVVPGQTGVPDLSGLFTPGAGTQTLSAFLQVTAGAGAANIVSPASLTRALYVEDMGAV